MSQRLYHLSDAELESILNASKPVPYMIIGGHAPSSPQENANNAWKVVARTHGFVWDSARPGGTGDDHDLLATPIPPVPAVLEAVDELNEKERTNNDPTSN